MKKIIKNNKSRDIAGIAAALALIAFSAIMMGLIFSQFSNETKNNQDQQLIKVESSVDYNINDAITRFSKQMDYVMTSRRLRSALDSDANGEGLTDILRNSSLSNLNTFEAMFVTRKGETYASSSDYDVFTVGEEIMEGVFECHDTAGNEYLAFRRDFNKKTACYGVMNIETMYESILPRTNAESESVMLLFDAGDALVYESGSEVMMCSVSEIPKDADLDRGVAELLVQSQKSCKVVKAEYEKGSSGKGASIRAVAVPSQKAGNGAFAVAVTADYSATASLVRGTVAKLLLFFAIAIAGIVILVTFLIKMRRERTQVDMELERLQEKNRQMEELNTKLQELEHHQRLETIGTMTSGIAHEFNNLLAPIMGYSIMTLEKLDPEDEILYDGVLEIYNASRKAKEIISRLSDLARKNTEKVFTKISPDPMVNRTISVTAPSLPNTVDLVRDFNCDGKYIMGNETQISQLLINLIINAFQAMAEDGGTVTVGTKAEDGYIVLTVKDDGPGIKDEIKESIFDPFFTTKEAGAGTGLGLAIVMQAAEDHNGHVELESEEGKGSCFRVYIPEYVDDSDED